VNDQATRPALVNHSPRPENYELVVGAALDPPQFLRQQFAIAQFRESGARGLLIGRAAGAQFGVAIVR
jgi:hypothetical protein